MKTLPSPNAACASRAADFHVVAQFRIGPHDAEPPAAAARAGFNDDRIADLLRKGERILDVDDAPSVPGTTGTPTDLASSRALTLLPISVMACGEGPMKVMPDAWQRSANSAFSDRNP